MATEHAPQEKGRYLYGTIVGLAIGAALWLFTVRMLIMAR